MNALQANVIMCAEPGSCCQPGTVLVVVGFDSSGDPVILEFCDKHGSRRLDSVPTRLTDGPSYPHTEIDQPRNPQPWL